MKSKLTSLMSKKLLTIRMGQLATEAEAFMKDKRIRHLPVVDELDDVVGILSSRDLKNLDNDWLLPVEALMSSPVEYVSEQATLHQVVLRLLEKKISSLLVINENEEILGIITTDDILWYLLELADEEPQKGITHFFNKQTIGALAQQLSNAGI